MKLLLLNYYAFIFLWVYLVIVTNYICKVIVLSLVADQKTSYARFEAQLARQTSETRRLSFSSKTFWNKQTNKTCDPPSFPHFSSIHPPQGQQCPDAFENSVLVSHKSTINGASQGHRAAPPGGSPASTGTPSASLSSCSVHLSVCSPSALLRLFPLNLWSFSTFESAVRLWNTKKRGADSTSCRGSQKKKKRKTKK